MDRNVVLILGVGDYRLQYGTKWCYIVVNIGQEFSLNCTFFIRKPRVCEKYWKMTSYDAQPFFENRLTPHRQYQVHYYYDRPFEDCSTLRNFSLNEAVIVRRTPVTLTNFPFYCLLLILEFSTEPSLL